MSHAMHVHSHPQTNRPERWYRADVSNTARADQRPELRGPRGQEYNGNDGDLRHMDGSGERAARRNPLVNAMMLALQGLTAATPAEQSTRPIETTEPVVEASESAPNDAMATDASAHIAKTSAGSLKEAAAAFAHELFGALRGEGGERDVKRHHGHHHHFGHHHGHGWGSRGGAEGAYSNLAQRLENLAAQFGSAPEPAPAAASAIGSTTSGQPGAAVPSVAAPESTDAPATADPADPVGVPVAEPVGQPLESDALPAEVAAGSAAGSNINLNISINIQVNFSATPASGVTSTPASKSPLLAAFEKLLEKLQSPASDTDSSDSANSSTARLREFLLGIASNLKAGLAGGEQSDLRPSSGSLINLAA